MWNQPISVLSSSAANHVGPGSLWIASAVTMTHQPPRPTTELSDPSADAMMLRRRISLSSVLTAPKVTVFLHWELHPSGDDGFRFQTQKQPVGSMKRAERPWWSWQKRPQPRACIDLSFLSCSVSCLLATSEELLWGSMLISICKKTTLAGPEHLGSCMCNMNRTLWNVPILGEDSGIQPTSESMSPRRRCHEVPWLQNLRLEWYVFASLSCSCHEVALWHWIRRAPTQQWQRFGNCSKSLEFHDVVCAGCENYI